MQKDMIFPCSLVNGLSQFCLFGFWLSLKKKKILEREIARSPGFQILSVPLSGARPDVTSYILNGTWEGKLGKYMSVVLRDFRWKKKIMYLFKWANFRCKCYY